MTDINKTHFRKKTAGPTPVESRMKATSILELMRQVITSCTLEEARDKIYLEQYSTISLIFQSTFILFWSL